MSAATEASFERPDGREGLEGGLVAIVVESDCQTSSMPSRLLAVFPKL